MAKIGVQQFQIRGEFTNQKKALLTLKTLSEWGVEGIEVDAFLLQRLPLAVRLLASCAGMSIPSSHGVKWVADFTQSGLEVLSLHEDLGTLEKKPEQAIALAKSLGTNTIVITGLYHFDYTDRAAVELLAERLNAVGKRLAGDSLRLLYHNHNCEFRPCGNEKAYEILLEKTDPAYVNFEFDVYWASECGADVSGWIDRLGKRMVMIHLTDRGNRNPGKMASIVKSDSLELGTGNFPLPLWIKKAEAAGVEALVIESHQNWIHHSAMASLKMSLDYLQHRP